MVESAMVRTGVSWRSQWWTHGVLSILGFVTLYPIIFMVFNALKNGIETAASPFSFPIHPHWNNFVLAFQAILPAFWQSIIVVIVSVSFMLVFSLLSAYAFAWLQFPGRELLFYVVFALLLIPGILTLIPLFIEDKNFGLLRTPWGLIFPYIAGGQAFCIFVLRAFVRNLQEDLFGAARIDGAGDIRIFSLIVAPLCVPILITLGLLNVVGIWGDYVFPQLVLGTQHETVAVAITNFIPPPIAPSLDAFNLQLAAFTLSAIPIALLFFLLMRYFIQGITDGGIKM